MLTAPAHGTPYHHLARTPANRWWRTLLGFVLGPLAYLVIVAAGALVLYLPAAVAGEQEDVGPLGEFAAGVGLIALMLPIVLLAAWWSQGRRPGSLSSVRGRLRWRWLLVCALLALAATLLSLGLGVGLSALTGSDAVGDFEWAGWATFVPALLVVLALVPLQAAAEEYLCRGWLLQSVAAFVAWRWVAIGVQALVFALMHGIGTAWGFADLIVFGVAAGWLAIRTGGLEAGIALHVVNNLLAFGLVVGTVGGLDIDETAADSGWQIALVDIVVIVGFAWVAQRLATRLHVEDTAPGPVELRPTQPALSPAGW